MRHVSKKVIMLAFICCLAAGLMLPPSVVNAAVENEGTIFKGRLFSEPEKIATPITKAGIAGAVIGNEDGKQVFYTTVNAELASFQIVDIQTNTLINKFDLEDVQQVWAHTIAPDGTVYIGGIRTSGQTMGSLWSYSPVTKTVTKLGELSEKSIWSMTTDEAGNVYMGTFQAGKVIKYDPVTKQFKDYGSMVAGQEYVRSMAYYDGYIYAGIGTVGDVVKLDVSGEGEGTKVSLGAELPSLLGVSANEISFAYDMSIVNDILLVKFDGLMTLAFYDLKKQEWIEHTITKDSVNGTGVGVYNFNQLAKDGNKVYLPANGHIVELDLTTFETKYVVKFGTSLRGAAWVEFTDIPGFTGKSLVTMNGSGTMYIINVEEGKVINRPSALIGAPNPIHNIEVGPEGNLYMSAYPAGIGAIYNPVTDTFTNLIMEQAEGMVAYGDSMYLGVYPGGHLEKIDTTVSPAAVERVLTIGEAQDRPYVMKTFEDKIMMGTIPGYGELGGALVIFDPLTEEIKVHRNVVQNQSIVGLAYKDGYIYGSTTVHGGLGINPSEKSAKMFVWDVANETKVAEFTLDIPGLSNPPMISALSVGPDGNIWGGVNGIVFVMDPKTYEVIDYNNIYPDINNYGMWRPYHAYWGEDGLLYMDLADRITVIDPKTLNYVRLFEESMEVKFMNIAKDASGEQAIYFADATDMGSLQKITVSDVQYAIPGDLALLQNEDSSDISVKLYAKSASELYSFKAKVSYDSSKFTVGSVTASDAWSANGMMIWSEDNGVITIVGTQYGNNSINGVTDLVNIVLQPLTNEANFYSPVTLLANAQSISIDGDETEYIHTLQEDRPIIVRHNYDINDVNFDGKVDAADLKAVANQIGSVLSEDNAQMDLNADGIINVVDAGLVGLEVLQ